MNTLTIIYGEIMIHILEKDRCCGCSSCVNICPQECIAMFPDEEGFLYPLVDIDRCIHCGKCEAVCPFIHYESPSNEITDECYAVQYRGGISSAANVLMKCASGGAYTGFAEYILKSGGLTVGAAFDEEMGIYHSFISSPENFTAHSSSKYVQSNMGDTYKKVKAVLGTGKKILFSGTPCQIVGLKNFLGKDYANLYCVDVICAGVASPKVFQEYKNIIRHSYSASIKQMNFKYKTFGYHSSTMKIVFIDNKKYSKSRLTDLMMRCFTSHICDRPSCGNCIVKGINRLSDISLFDCWHYEFLTGNKDNELGHTAILIHSKKGKQLLESCRDTLEIERIDIQQAIQFDGNMVEGIQQHHLKREVFFEVFNQCGLKEAVKRFIPIRLSDYLKEISKKILYQLGLLQTVKRIFHKGV